MEWFYGWNGQQTGPVSDGELRNLVASGVVTPATLVWREGMTEWKPVSQTDLAGATMAAPGSPPPLYPPPMYTASGTPPPLGTTVRYAGFWIRFAAIVIDGLILSSVHILLNASVGVYSTRLPNDFEFRRPGFFLVTAVVSLISLCVGILYQAYFLPKFGATPGKMLFGLKVIRADGGPVTTGIAVLRFFGYILDWITLGIGFLIAAFDVEKRALHDFLCGTRVIHARR